jgi:hypothetical protein
MINEVRNTVLSILNKNNYGYISPSDFNLFAKNAQMEMYEEYYSSFNKTMNAENGRASGSDYADISKPLMEVLESFLMNDFIVPKVVANPYLPTLTNNFYVPSTTTVGNAAYMINKVIVYTKLIISGFTSNTTPFVLEDFAVDFIVAGVKVGDIVVNSTTYQSSAVISIISTTILILQDDIFQDPLVNEGYTIYDASSYSEAEKVSNSKILLLQNSLLTTPSLIYPSYTNIGELMTLYPTTIQGYGAVRCDYFRYPKVPKWTYITLSNGEPVFDQSQLDYQDFELPTEDSYKLVMKICQYCGISIREMEVTQYALAQEQHEQPSFSVQQ